MKYSIELLDMMDGHDFEYAVADLLRHNGWKDVEVTQGSNDYGIDILARRGRTKYAIQCKRYNSAVGVKAVQEAGLGVDYYHYDAAAVITNSSFTKQAENIAGVTGVRLWGRDYLEELIENYDDRYDGGHGSQHNKFHSHNQELFFDVDTTNSSLSKVCPICRREFLSASLKCPICNCSLTSLAAQKRLNKMTQEKTLLQKDQKTIPQIQLQQRILPPNTAVKRKNRLRDKPSKLSIAALILSFLGGLSTIGIILAIIDLRKKDGYKKTYSVIALIVGCFMVALLVALDNHMHNDSVDYQAKNVTGNDYSESFSTDIKDNNMENLSPDNTTDNIELGKKEQILNSLTDNSSINDKLLELNYIPENNYTEIVLLGYTSGFTDKQNIEGTYFYILEVLESLQPIIDTDVSISVKYPILDVYGNSGVQDVIYSYYTLATIQKINFNSFYSDNIPVIADYWEDAEIFRIKD